MLAQLRGDRLPPEQPGCAQTPFARNEPIAILSAVALHDDWFEQADTSDAFRQCGDVALILPAPFADLNQGQRHVHDVHSSSSLRALARRCREPEVTALSVRETARRSNSANK